MFDSDSALRLDLGAARWRSAKLVLLYLTERANKADQSLPKARRSPKRPISATQPLARRWFGVVLSIIRTFGT